MSRLTLAGLLRSLCTAALAGLLAAGAQAQIVYREVLAQGNGGDPAKATIDAIENAIAQVGGMKISTATSLSMSEVTQGNQTQFQESFRQNIEKTTRGMVKSYTVLESGTSPGTGRAYVKIRALIPSYKPSEQLKRLKLVVLPVAVAGAAASQPEAAAFAERVSASLEAFLTQTRKFAMLDRRYIEGSGRELGRANTAAAPLDDTVRLGQRVGADYLVMAVLKDFERREVAQQRVTGRTVTRASVPVAIDVRVVDVATGQIKFAQTYTHPGRLPSLEALVQHAADVGADIGQVIGSAIYPVAVVAGSGQEITLNQGGDTVQVGRVYRLVSLGAPLVDPYTKESLGPQETEVGRAEVTQVTDRTATARLTAGSLPTPLVPGKLLARLLPDVPTAPVAVQVSLPGQAAGGPKGKKDDEDW